MKRFEEVCFYCYFGNGDIFNSKGLVRDMINSFPDKRYFYAHSKSSRILEDLPLTSVGIIKEIMPGDKHYLVGNAKDLYFNTWIGLDSKYVLPGVGVTLSKYIILYNDILKKLKVDFRFVNNPYLYIPDTDYSKVQHKGNVWAFNEVYPGRKILISTGDVFSNQSENFDFAPIVEELCLRHKDTQFITTTDLGIWQHNYHSTPGITQTLDGFDLNEISYLSTMCDVIIGRSSGPYVFCQTKTNLMNPNKKFLSFTYHKNSSDLCLGMDLPAKRFHSNDFSTKGVLEKIEEVLCE